MNKKPAPKYIRYTIEGTLTFMADAPGEIQGVIEYIQQYGDAEITGVELTDEEEG